MVEPDEIERALSAGVTARPDAIIIGGGDGTVRSAAAALADSGISLGVLPMGTLNHFAKDLEIPFTLPEAVDALVSGTVQSVDAAEVNGHLFINNCSLGTYAEAVKRREALRREQGHGKWRAMFKASWQAFRRFKRMRMRVSIPGVAVRDLHTPLIVVGNNAYSGHVLHGSLRARLDEGKLWLYIAHVHRHLAALRMAWQSLTRRLDAADALAAEPVTEFTIESDTPIHLAADGEILELPSPWRFRIRPGALRVIVPKTTT